MGNLELDCVARSPNDGNKLVGVSITNNYTIPNNYFSPDSVVLVESQPNSSTTGSSPLNHNNLVWSTIAAFPVRHLTVRPGSSRSSACSISDTGVFTFYAESSGFQYLPDGMGTTTTMDPGFGYSGKGTWRNVTVSEKVVWTWQHSNLKLFYTKPSAVGTGGGKERLMFVASTSKSFGSWDVVLGEFNAATGSLDLAGSWTWAYRDFGEPKSFANAGEELYLYAANGDGMQLSAISLQNVNTTAPIVLRTYNATSTSTSCSVAADRSRHSAVYNGVYYLACGHQQEVEPRRSGLFTIADISTNTSSFTPRVNITYGGLLGSNFFIPMGGNSPGSAPFAFLQYEYSVRSLPLGGPQAGAIVDTANLTIPEPFGLDPNPKKPSNNDKEDGLGAGGVLGIIAALLFFIVGGGFLLRLRKKTSSKGGDVPQGHGVSQMRMESYGPDGPNSYRYPPQQQQQQHPSHILPMAPLTPIAAVGVTTQHQTYQDQMQALQFSSHPRPNVVTTAYSSEPESSSPTIPYPGWSGAPQTAWQPTPFVPPVRPTSSTGPSSPAAGHSPSPSATAFSNAPGQSFQDPQAIVYHNGAETPNNSSSRPLPSLPSIPHDIRPSPEVGSPHT